MKREIPNPVECLIDNKAFYKAFQEFSQASQTYREAYEKTEKYIEEATGHRRYEKGGYCSFRVSKSRLQKNKAHI